MNASVRCFITYLERGDRAFAHQKMRQNDEISMSSQPTLQAMRVSMHIMHVVYFRSGIIFALPRSELVML